MNSPSITQADTAGGSPVVQVPRTPLEPAAATSSNNELGDEVYIEAATARYYLDDEDDEPCCWGLWPLVTCKKSPSAPLNEALLATPPLETQHTDEYASSICCCRGWCLPEKLNVAERHTLPRLSSTLLGMRSTPSGSNRVSSPPSPRGRSSSSHTDTMSVTGLPSSRQSSRSFDGTVNGGKGIEVVRKIVMLGARNSGKSSVVQRFAEGKFGAAYDPTIESTIRAKISFKGVTFMCDILDTAGQDEYSNFSRQATVGVHGYCMVFSVTSMQSFLAIQKIHDRITELVGSYTVPTVLVGTKSDDETRREVPTSAGEALAESWGTTFIECSAKSDFGIYDVFETLLHEIERDSGLLASKDSQSSEEVINRKSCAIS